MKITSTPLYLCQPASLLQPLVLSSQLPAHHADSSTKPHYNCQPTSLQQPADLSMGSSKLPFNLSMELEIGPIMFKCPTPEADVCSQRRAGLLIATTPLYFFGRLTAPQVRNERYAGKQSKARGYYETSKLLKVDSLWGNRTSQPLVLSCPIP
jgi:hypothetical protein